jgi:hypothetical protein
MLMVTDAAPFATLLRVTAGADSPNEFSRISRNVPDLLYPMIAPPLVVVAAATLVIAGWALVGLVSTGWCSERDSCGAGVCEGKARSSQRDDDLAVAVNSGYGSERDAHGDGCSTFVNTAQGDSGL